MIYELLLGFLFLNSVFFKTRASIFLESCSLTCKGNDDSGHTDIPTEQRVLGYPGKRGPVGPPGPPGPEGKIGPVGNPGTNCKCEDRGSDIEARLDKLEKAMEKFSVALKFAALQSSGWTQASSNGLWYKLFFEKFEYVEARARCQEENARLASAGIRDPAVLREIKLLLYFDSGGYVHIGLDDLEKRNDWYWSDGVKSTRSNTPWEKGQPNKSSQRCGVIGKNWKVYDDQCSDEYYFLCEKTV